MATRSSVAVKLASGKTLAVYCHWDGYLQGVGKTLVNHYTSLDKIMELIVLGDISSLRPEIGAKHAFDNPHKFGTQEYNLHKESVDDMTTFYGRDRSEKGVEFRAYDSPDEYVKKYEYSGVEFFYLYDITEGEWLFTEAMDRPFESVSKVLDQLESIAA